MRHETLPADHLFGRRVEMLTLAVLGQLRAHGNWHRVAREWMYGDEPVTELGRQEARSTRRSPLSARLAWLRLACWRAASLRLAAAGAGSRRGVRVVDDRRSAPLVFIALSAALTFALFPGRGRVERAAVRHRARHADLDRRRDARRHLRVPDLPPRRLDAVGSSTGSRRPDPRLDRRRGFLAVLYARSSRVPFTSSTTRPA